MFIDLYQNEILTVSRLFGILHNFCIYKNCLPLVFPLRLLYNNNCINLNLKIFTLKIDLWTFGPFEAISSRCHHYKWNDFVTHCLVFIIIMLMALMCMCSRLVRALIICINTVAIATISSKSMQIRLSIQTIKL